MTARRRPNILVLLADELRADALGCFGHPVIRTPHLDRLAAGGVRFDQCRIPQPTCTPCRASLLGGTFPSALRSRMVGCRTPDDPRFLPRILGAAGYRTASIGKIHLVPQGDEPEAIEATRRPDGTVDYYGFREVDLVNGHGDHCFGPDYTSWVQERIRAAETDPPAHESLCNVPGCYRWPLPPEAHSGTYIADRAVSFLEDAPGGSAPWFLHCSFPDPHHPFTVPEPYASLYAPEAMPTPLPPITECVDPPPVGLDAYRGRPTAFRKPNGQGVDHVIGTPAHPYAEYTAADWAVVRAVTGGMVTLLDACVGRVLDALEATGQAENTLVVFASDHGDYLGD
ncbi:MAG: sulfatase, partial [Planctomycetota bacterium]